MNHITKEKSVDIAREHLWRYKPSGHPKQSDAYLFNDECMQALCNAAIEWHIAQQAAREPVAYLMTFSDGTTTIQKTAYWDSCISVDGLYLAAGAAPTLCTNNEWLANCPQEVRDFAAKIKAEQEQT